MANRSIESIATYIILLLLIYWLLFDIGLNKRRGKDLLFVGTTAWLDKKFANGIYITRKFKKDPGSDYQMSSYKEIILSPEYTQLTVKLICLIASAGGYIYFK